MDEVALPPAPDWLLGTTSGGADRGEPPPADGEPIPEGQRNTTLTSLGGTMRRRGRTADEIEIALLAVNRARCRPPLDDAEVRGIATSLSRYEPKDEEDPSGFGEAGDPEEMGNDEDSGRKTQAARLVELASPADLFHTPDGDAYATIPVDGHYENWRVRSKGFKSWLLHRFYRDQDRVPSNQALQDAIGLLEARALFDGPEHVVPVRLAEHEGAIYLDLGNRARQAVKITAEGWQVIADPPVKFNRPRGMLALPTPERGGHIDELRPLVNVASIEDWRVLVGYLTSTLHPTGPYPILALTGPPGSAKSTVSALMVGLVDPSSAPLRSPPRELRDLMIAAENGWCLAFNNLSKIAPWLSDALCCLSTGGGFSTRELYSDRDEIIFEGKRPVIINAVTDVATYADLADRLVALTLAPIPDTKRRDERELWAAFERARPRILGALLDGVATALANLPQVRIRELPRLADFAKWATAAEPAFGWPRGSFMRAYTRNRRAATEVVLEASPIFPFLRAVAEEGFSGTATELLKKINAQAVFAPTAPMLSVNDPTRAPGWPKSATALSGQLRSLAPSLPGAGIVVEFAKTGGSGSSKLITLRTVAKKTRQSRKGRRESDAADAPPRGGDAGPAREDGAPTTEPFPIGPEPDSAGGASQRAAGVADSPGPSADPGPGEGRVHDAPPAEVVFVSSPGGQPPSPERLSAAVSQILVLAAGSRRFTVRVRPEDEHLLAEELERLSDQSQNERLTRVISLLRERGSPAA